MTFVFANFRAYKSVEFPKRTGWDTATKLGSYSACSVWILEKQYFVFF